MKYLMFHLSALLLLTALLLVGCNKNDTLVSSSTETIGVKDPNNTDTPVDEILFWVDEYVKITDKDNNVSYQFRQMAVLTAPTGLWVPPPFPAPPYPTVNFTTPASSRYEGGDLVETQFYVYDEYARWHEQPCNYGARYRIDLASNENSHYLFDFYAYSNFPCDEEKQSCVTDEGKESFCTTSGLYHNYVTNFYLPPNTALSVHTYGRSYMASN